VGFIALLLVTACNDDGVGGADGTGETGDPGADPVDPLDGEGTAPSGEPSLARDAAPPSSLGNGLVHDTRSRVRARTFSSQANAAEFEHGAAWSGFVGVNNAILRRGFRPAQVDAAISLSGGLELTDNSLYISDDDANYRTEVFTHVFSTLAAERAFSGWGPPGLGARPTSIQTFAVDGHLGYSVGWVYDSATTTPTTAWVMKVGQTKAELDALLADSSFRPLALSSRWRDGGSEYAVILLATSSHDDWSSDVNIPSSQLGDRIKSRWQDGFYPFRITAQDQRSTHLNVLWTTRPTGISVQPRVNLTDSTFADEDGYWRSHGYHLETTSAYVAGGQPRHAAVWVRYEPYLRWQGSKFVPGDPKYDTKYKMFHDQALRVMASLTEVDCSDGEPCPTGTGCYECPGDVPCFHEGVCVANSFGAWTHPSATLHIFEGPTVAFNRAYTFGPSIYPDTPINAPMKTASVSKSITSAAVIRELAVQGKTVKNTSFQSAINSPYPLLSESGPVRVMDVLNHQGGFAFSPEPSSYRLHAQIVEAGAVAPVDGEDLFAYAFAAPPNGKVGVGTASELGSYWQPEWIEPGSIKYSNPGYSIAGELLRVQSGLSYSAYITNEFLAPLNLQERIVPDPGSRFATRGPTRVLAGGHLIDTAHPYNVASPNPIEPSVGLAPNPVEDWYPYLGPPDPRAPDRATTRYGGNRYLGGAPLAAGGWWADGEALGVLIREISSSDTIFPASLTDTLWHPWGTYFGDDSNLPAVSWGYNKGWYVRGNWVAWMGSDFGGMAIALYNRIHDVTVVFMTNGTTFPTDFINPLMATVDGQPGTSPVGKVWPCAPDPNYAWPISSCQGIGY